MKNTRKLIIVLLILVPLKTIIAQQGKPVVDYLKLGGPIVFEKTSYHLAWTSHPTNNFYKQEYLQKTDVLPKFRKMVLIDLITGDQNIKNIIAEKVAELKKMQQSNPVVNYEVMENKTSGEYILDFLLSQNAPDGKSIEILERNVYRYKKIADKSGRHGILLFGVSTRSYGDEVTGFLTALKSNRSILVKNVSQFTLPSISL